MLDQPGAQDRLHEIDGPEVEGARRQSGGEGIKAVGKAEDGAKRHFDLRRDGLAEARQGRGGAGAAHQGRGMRLDEAGRRQQQIGERQAGGSERAGHVGVVLPESPDQIGEVDRRAGQRPAIVAAERPVLAEQRPLDDGGQQRQRRFGVGADGDGGHAAPRRHGAGRHRPGWHADQGAKHEAGAAGNDHPDDVGMLDGVDESRRRLAGIDATDRRLDGEALWRPRLGGALGGLNGNVEIGSAGLGGGRGHRLGQGAGRRDLAPIGQRRHEWQHQQQRHGDQDDDGKARPRSKSMQQRGQHGKPTRKSEIRQWPI